MEHGITYSDFSRDTMFDNFGLFNEITSNRLINSIFWHKKMYKSNSEEQRLVHIRNVNRNKHDNFATSFTINTLKVI